MTNEEMIVYLSEVIAEQRKDIKTIRLSNKYLADKEKELISKVAFLENENTNLLFRLGLEPQE